MKSVKLMDLRDDNFDCGDIDFKIIEIKGAMKYKEGDYLSESQLKGLYTMGYVVEIVPYC